MAEQAEQVEEQQHCERHPDEELSSQCSVCGKSICRECMKEFGYYCSPECLEQSRAAVTDEDRENSANAAADLQKAALVGKIIVSCMVVGGLLAGAYLLWKFVLDPTGKVQWTWEGKAPLFDMRVLCADDAKIIVQCGDRVVTLDPSSGTETAAFKLERDEPKIPKDAGAMMGFFAAKWQSRLASPLHYVDTCFYRLGRGSVERLSVQGKVDFKREFEEGSVSQFQLSDDKAVAYFIATTPKDMDAVRAARAELAKCIEDLKALCKQKNWSYEGRTYPSDNHEVQAIWDREAAAHNVFSNTQRHLHCIDFATGEDKWTKKLKKQVGLSRMAVGSVGVTGVFTITDEDHAQTTMLCCLKSDTGKRAWQTELPAPVTWGPVVESGMVLFDVQGEILALTEAGEQTYSIDAPADSIGHHLAKDGLLFVCGESGTTCYDVKSGAKKWALGVSLGGEAMVAGQKRLFARTYIEEKLAAQEDVKLPPAYEEIQNMDEVSGMLKRPDKRTVPVIIGIDRESGKELWRQRNAFGDMLGDDGRLIVVADTAQTSALNVVTGSKGETFIRQFNGKSGKELYQRLNEVGFASPHLVGKQLVGFSYVRTKSLGMLNPEGGDGDDEPIQGTGMCAIRVR